MRVLRAESGAFLHGWLEIHDPQSTIGDVRCEAQGDGALPVEHNYFGGAC
jgi:hypothetical protein